MINVKSWLSSPTMHGDEIKYYKKLFFTNWVAPLGPNVDAFERAMADNICDRSAVA